MIRHALLLTLCFAVAATQAPVAGAKNVDLVTLPSRDTVQLTIYNSEDLTFVKETRSLTLKKGENRLQFSWANTLIDPTSVEFRPLEHPDEIEVADTVFPGQKPQHLVWSIRSTYEGQVPVEVSYFTSGLTWQMDYVATCDPNETEMDFEGHVRVFNESGEAYENARIRLIVGTINLVEKIADLAQRRGIPMPAPASPMREKMRAESAKRAFDQAALAAGAARDGEKAIVKEGLSEYFMFTVEGTETIANGWSKRMKAVESQDHAFAILYRMRAHQYGPRPVRFFLWGNDAEHGLGDSPLPDGTVRVFRENGQDGLSYLGEQVLRYVPVRAPIEVNLGADDLVVYESRARSTQRLDFRFKHNRVIGWDEKTAWLDTLRNYRAKPIRFELHRIWPGDVEYTSATETRLFDYRTVEVTFSIPARGKQVYGCTILLHRGANEKQGRVKLSEAKGR